ncbi:hypothetical protein ACVWZM_005242 [Bradyrhizobium sp. USDA 4501]
MNGVSLTGTPNVASGTSGSLIFRDSSGNLMASSALYVSNSTVPRVVIADTNAAADNVNLTLGSSIQGGANQDILLTPASGRGVAVGDATFTPSATLDVSGSTPFVGNSA